MAPGRLPAPAPGPKLPARPRQAAGGSPVHTDTGPSGSWGRHRGSHTARQEQSFPREGRGEKGQTPCPRHLCTLFIPTCSLLPLQLCPTRQELALPQKRRTSLLQGQKGFQKHCCSSLISSASHTARRHRSRHIWMFREHLTTENKTWLLSQLLRFFLFFSISLFSFVSCSPSLPARSAGALPGSARGSALR